MNKYFFVGCAFLIALVYTTSCKKEAIQNEKILTAITIPSGFSPINFPPDNQFTPERWAFGKKLFYDTRLSKNNTVSCANCHKAELAFSDNVAFSLGDENTTGKSNAPTLTNIAYNPYFTRAGGVPTLEMQVLVPIQEHEEFNTNILTIVDKLKADSGYVKAARNCYQRELDPYVLTRAIANFERSIISGNSRYDQYFFQQKNTALSAAELRGKDLFFSSRTNCSQCHSNFNFTSYSFENNGLYIYYADSGRMRFTQLEIDRGKFKVPTLRNVALTAPYMHDGSLNTLEAVIEHYNLGGKNNSTKSNFIQPLGLSTQEKADLVAFLKALTDDDFVKNEYYQR